jgi:hypothetical protein
MPPLSSKTRRIIERLFARESHEEVRGVLERECGANLPFAEKLGDAGTERVRLAVLKLSDGDLAKLRETAGHAKVDWRDVLVEAGFGESLGAHGDWVRGILASRPDPLAADIDRLPGEFRQIGAAEAFTAIAAALNGKYATSTDLLRALDAALESTRESWAPRVSEARRREIDQLRDEIRVRFR